MKSIIFFVKKFLENNIGRKNLSNAEINNEYLIFCIKSMRFVVSFENLSVKQYINCADGEGYVNTEISYLIQRRLRSEFEKEINKKQVI